MSDKLKPCPFCGARAEFRCHWPDRGHSWYEVECTNSDCGGGVGDTADEAEKSWNARHPAAEVRALVEAANTTVRGIEVWNDAVESIIGRQPNANLFTKDLKAALAALEAEDD